MKCEASLPRRWYLLWKGKSAQNDVIPGESLPDESGSGDYSEQKRGDAGLTVEGTSQLLKAWLRLRCLWGGDHRQDEVVKSGVERQW